MISAVGDSWRETFPQRFPSIPIPQQHVDQHIHIGVSKEDFDALKREVELLKEMLIAAKQYDEATGQPDCEMEEKVDLLKRIAALVGVDLQEVFG
jgi:hypothetical protein